MNAADQTNEFRNETVIFEATFRKKEIVSYQILSSTVGLACTVVGICALPLSIPLIYLIGPKIVDTWECTLTNRAVHVKKGMFVKVKKTIPLEKITDVGSMRRFGLHALSFETAGQSGAAGGALVKLVGIDDSDSFRDLVLDTRDAASVRGDSTPGPDSSQKPAADEQEVLHDIRDSLLRIEKQLKQSD